MVTTDVDHTTAIEVTILVSMTTVTETESVDVVVCVNVEKETGSVDVVVCVTVEKETGSVDVIVCVNVETETLDGEGIGGQSMVMVDGAATDWMGDVPNRPGARMFSS